jgi:hypothetical protein
VFVQGDRHEVVFVRGGIKRSVEQSVQLGRGAHPSQLEIAPPQLFDGEVGVPAVQLDKLNLDSGTVRHFGISRRVALSEALSDPSLSKVQQPYTRDRTDGPVA